MIKTSIKQQATDQPWLVQGPTGAIALTTINDWTVVQSCQELILTCPQLFSEFPDMTFKDKVNLPVSVDDNNFVFSHDSNTS